MKPEPYKSSMSIYRLTRQFVFNKNKLHSSFVNPRKKRRRYTFFFNGGRYVTRTRDPHNVDVMRYQLRQSPTIIFIRPRICDATSPRKILNLSRRQSQLRQSPTILTFTIPYGYPIRYPSHKIIRNCFVRQSANRSL